MKITHTIGLAILIFFSVNNCTLSDNSDTCTYIIPAHYTIPIEPILETIDQIDTKQFELTLTQLPSMCKHVKDLLTIKLLNKKILAKTLITTVSLPIIPNNISERLGLAIGFMAGVLGGSYGVLNNKLEHTSRLALTIGSNLLFIFCCYRLCLLQKAQASQQENQKIKQYALEKTLKEINTMISILDNLPLQPCI